MLDVFDSLKWLMKKDSVCIENNVFRLHYSATFIMLLACSLSVTASQYVGDPIECSINGETTRLMDTYCWIHSTFTVPGHLSGIVGKDIAHPGIGSQVESDKVKYHKYYQWVCFVLFFQAILFYAPRYLWKIWEGGRLKMLVMDLNRPLVSEELKAEHNKLLVDYFVSNLHTQNFYAVKYFICEVLNFVNVLLQIYFMDYFLGGEFSTYGLNVFQFIQMEQEDRIDPMSTVFPKVTKCIFHKYGPSGTIEKLDGVCVLPQNNVNEKIYVLLWIWFTLLALITGLSLIYRTATLMSPRFRLYLLRARSRLSPPNQMKTIARKCQIGDWFVLYQLSKNMDHLIFKDFTRDLAIKLGRNKTV